MGAETLQLSRIADLVSRSVTVANRLSTRQPSILFTPLSASPAAKLLQGVAEGGLVHLHNAYNLVSLPRLARLKGVVAFFATLHDERLLTAGCHSTLGCESAASGCHSCPQSRCSRIIPFPWAQAKQREKIANLGIHLITPSRGVRERAASLGVSRELLHWIPNPIDLKTFAPQSRQHLTSSAHESQRAWTLAWLPGKDDETFWTALTIVQRALINMGDPVEIRILTVERAEVPNQFKVIRVPPPASERQRADFWRSADLAVSITKADNFPNVALEAVAVGTPMCISAVGGCSEVVQETGGGFVCQGPTATDVAGTLLNAASRRHQMGPVMIEARAHMEERYSYEAIGARYADLYHAVLESGLKDGGAT